MKSFVPVFSLMLLCSACAGDPAGKDGAQASAPGDPADSVKGTPGAFYKRFSGTLGNRKVVLNLQQYHAHYSGSLYDLATNRPVKLMINNDETEDNHYSLIELTAPGRATRWELTLTGTTLKGTQTGPDSASTEVTLQEEYPAGSYQLAAYHIQDTGRLFYSRREPRATASFGMVWPAGSWDRELAGFVQSRISVGMDFQGKDGVEAGLKARTNRYFSFYRNELKSVVDSTLPDERLADMAYHYSSVFYHEVMYNDNNWLVLENALNNYTGGAHGLYNGSFHNLDMQTKTDWKLNYVVRDTAALKPYLELAARDYFGIRPTEALSSRLLVPAVPPTANFYITPAGLTFVYNPYELASYSDGEIQLFLPFDKLMDLLTPDFKKRMNFKPSSGVAMKRAATSAPTNHL